MSKNYELDSLKAEQDAAFRRKQEAFQNYDRARNSANAAHDIMQNAWDERVRARERMNEEFERRKEAFGHRDSVWEDYARIRDYNNSQIESLKYDADFEHRAMQDCFDRASDAYAYGDKSEAPILSQEGHEHKARRDELNAEISRLANEVKSAKAYAEMRAPRVDSSSFESAKAEFERAKAFHESAQTEFKNRAAERDRLKDMFETFQAEHARCQESFQNKLAQVKSDNRRERDKILDKAGVASYEREDAKIVKKSDGTTQVYHGGFGRGDGLGHGHTAIDSTGKVEYDRKAFESHGKQNYTDSDGVTIYDRRLRRQHEVMGIEGDFDVQTRRGHNTHYYKDGLRESRDTFDGIHEENIHWTNQNIPKGKRNFEKRHAKPDDAR